MKENNHVILWVVLSEVSPSFIWSRLIFPVFSMFHTRVWYCLNRISFYCVVVNLLEVYQPLICRVKIYYVSSFSFKVFFKFHNTSLTFTWTSWSCLHSTDFVTNVPSHIIFYQYYLYSSRVWVLYSKMECFDLHLLVWCRFRSSFLIYIYFGL